MNGFLKWWQYIHKYSVYHFSRNECPSETIHEHPKKYRINYILMHKMCVFSLLAHTFNVIDHCNENYSTIIIQKNRSDGLYLFSNFSKTEEKQSTLCPIQSIRLEILPTWFEYTWRRWFKHGKKYGAIWYRWSAEQLLSVVLIQHAMFIWALSTKHINNIGLPVRNSKNLVIFCVMRCCITA